MDDLVALAARFESGKLSARDIAKIIGCGLRGAGEEVSDDEVAAMRDGGRRGGLCEDCGGADPRDVRRDGGEEREGENPPQAEPLAWDELMAFGLGVLRLSPAAFWGMTLRELAAAMRGGVSGGRRRSGADGLMS